MRNPQFISGGMLLRVCGNTFFDQRYETTQHNLLSKIINKTINLLSETINLLSETINLLSETINLPSEMINIDTNDKFIVLCCFGA